MVRKYRQAVVPTFLKPDEVERVLTATDRSTLSGRRPSALHWHFRVMQDRGKEMSIVKSSKKIQPVRNMEISAFRLRTVGIDLGDKFSHDCTLADDGDVIEEGRVKTTSEGFTAHFQGVPNMHIALETGTHSAWGSQLLTSFGHEVIVANAGQIPAITGSDKKTDPNDAESLARFARFDPKLLHPITHRDRSKQLDLTVIRLRARIVEVRTTLINSVRSTAKGFGPRLPPMRGGQFR